MAKQRGGRETFVVQVLSEQNATWQGLITWTERRETQPFRSALELIKLIDSALEQEDPHKKRTTWEKTEQPTGI